MLLQAGGGGRGQNSSLIYFLLLGNKGFPEMVKQTPFQVSLAVTVSHDWLSLQGTGKKMVFSRSFVVTTKPGLC